MSRVLFIISLIAAVAVTASASGRKEDKVTTAEQQSLQVDSLRNRADSLDLVIDSLAGLLVGKDSIIVDLRDSLDSMSAYIAGLQPFVDEYTKKTLLSRRTYLDTLYSEMSEDTLINLKGRLKEYAVEPKVKHFIRDIDSVLILKKRYDWADSMLHASLKSAVVLDSTIRDIWDVQDNVPLSESQWAEFDTLQKNLRNYRVSVTAIYNLMRSIDDDIQYNAYYKYIKTPDSTEIENCFAHINYLFGDKAGRRQFLEKCRVPYIEELYDRYKNALKKDPFRRKEEVRDIEEEIKWMKKQADIR